MNANAARLPNFFIIGAPKCGTTALWEYLYTHPAVFMPRMKEPHLYNTDQKFRIVKGRQAYLDLFAEAPATATALGEASVWYLYSQTAVPEILKDVPEARLVVMVRKPVDMFHSLHDQLMVNRRETIADPEEAWKAQERRRQGIDLPKLVVEPSHVQYREVCSVGAQLERLLALVPRERVHVIFYDDFSKNTRAEYLKVLEFLGLEDDGLVEFPRYNASKELRSWPLRVLTKAVRKLKRATGIRANFGMVARVERLNVRYRERQPLRPEFRAELVHVFADDVMKLERITGRDLSAWRRA